MRIRKPEDAASPPAGEVSHTMVTNRESSTPAVSAAASGELHQAAIHFAEGQRLLLRAFRRQPGWGFLGPLTRHVHRLVRTVEWIAAGEIVIQREAGNRETLKP
jgi:hypothetical protein